MRLAEARDHGQPRGNLESIADKRFSEPAGYGSLRGRNVLARRIARRSANRKNVIKEVALVLSESVHSRLNAVFPNGCAYSCLQTGVIGCLLHIRDHRHIVRRGVVAGFVVMIEG